MRKFYFPVFFSVVFLCLIPIRAFAHCEIPCGIYDDGMRIQMIYEHIATIEKSMKQIQELEKTQHHHANQLIRWVMNKEHHADEIQEIAAQYFMTQRIQTDTKNYEEKLGLLHRMLIFSMKCKQTTDLDNVEKLKEIVKDFNMLYFKK
jgi:nickel superoxide dismutase